MFFDFVKKPILLRAQYYSFRKQLNPTFFNILKEFANTAVHYCHVASFAVPRDPGLHQPIVAAVCIIRTTSVNHRTQICACFLVDYLIFVLFKGVKSVQTFSIKLPFTTALHSVPLNLQMLAMLTGVLLSRKQKKMLFKVRIGI